MQHDKSPRWARRSGRAFLIFLGALTVATGAMVGPFGLMSPASGQSPAPSGEYRVELEVAWRNVGGEVLRLDAYVPADERRHPAVVLVHGGAWTGGDKADVAEQGRALAAAGYVAVAVNYRLAPAHRYPAAVEDVQAAVAWLRAPSQVVNYRVDPHRIGLFGASAGGNLTTMVGAAGSGSRDSGNRVAVVVSWSGLTDLNGFAQLPDFGQEYLGCAARSCPQLAADASPIAHLDPSDSPMLLINAADDPITPAAQATTMEAALGAARINHEVVVVPGSAHATVMAPDVWGTTLAYLTRYLQPDA
jgi:acetyl esterase